MTDVTKRYLVPKGEEEEDDEKEGRNLDPLCGLSLSVSVSLSLYREGNYPTLLSSVLSLSLSLSLSCHARVVVVGTGWGGNLFQRFR